MLFECGFRSRRLKNCAASTRQTPVSLSFIRRLVKTGAVPSVPVGAGKRRLVNFDALIEFLSNPPTEQPPTARGIRPVSERW